MNLIIEVNKLKDYKTLKLLSNNIHKTILNYSSKIYICSNNPIILDIEDIILFIEKYKFYHEVDLNLIYMNLEHINTNYLIPYYYEFKKSTNYRNTILYFDIEFKMFRKSQNTLLYLDNLILKDKPKSESLIKHLSVDDEYL